MNEPLTLDLLQKLNQDCPALLDAGFTAKHKSPEQLVGLGFRFWMTGYRTGEFACWARSWDYFNRHLGVETARSTITDLAFWVQTVQQAADREIEVAPWESSEFHPNERMAITMIAAGQHNACPALAACAYALIGAEDVEPVVTASTRFANHLLANNLELQPATHLARFAEGDAEAVSAASA